MEQIKLNLLIIVYLAYKFMSVEGKKSVVVGALSQKPCVLAVSIAYHHELHKNEEAISEEYGFARICT